MNLNILRTKISEHRRQWPGIQFIASSDPQVEDHEIRLDETCHIQVSLDLRTFTPCRELPDSVFDFGPDCSTLRDAINRIPPKESE